MPTFLETALVHHHVSICGVTGSVLTSCATALEQCPRWPLCSLSTAQEQWHTHKTTRDEALDVGQDRQNVSILNDISLSLLTDLAGRPGALLVAVGL